MLKTDYIEPAQMIEMLRQKLSEVEYRATINEIVINQYRALIDEIVKKHPQIKKEVEEKYGIKQGE
ncbi:hypothetical protein ONZ78_01550 [Lactobacillus mulieris]|uniref:hypothetical protein n=1 Tax=Lactobacillus mulieris TaxID=2508708 RepID=UPI0022441BD4|nr:hypothetical protein [Lactobacillus mulieris]MCW8105467.1 hypothetical protein [Lactobacillus mulieris]MDK7348113.1 hypothetical protein [Lactobacillus mulieris]